MIQGKSRLAVHLWTVDITQVKLAEMIGYHLATVHAAVRRGTSSPRLRRKISEALDVPEQELFPNDPRPEK